MKKLLTCLTFVFFSVHLFAQVDIPLVYGETKVLPEPKELEIGKSLTLSLLKPVNKTQATEFFSKTFIQVMNEKGNTLARISLKEGIEGKKEKIDDLVKNNRIQKLDILKYISEAKAGYQIRILPYLGEGIVSSHAFIIVNVVEKKTEPELSKTEINTITAKVDENKKEIGKLSKEVSDLKDKEAQDISDIKSSVRSVENELKSIGFSKLTKKQQAEIAERLKNANNTDLANFEDCDKPGCKDQDKDLIYDFRCKRLYEVQKTRKDGIYYTDYVPVTNLNKIKVNAQKLVSIKVVGINRYLYSMDITVQDSIYNSSPPPIFNQFFSGSSDLYTGLLEKGKTSALQADPLNPEEVKNSFEELENKLTEFKKKYNVLIDKQTKAYLFCLDKDIDCCGKDELEVFSVYSDLLSDVMVYIAKLEAEYLAEISSSTKIISDINEAQTKLDGCSTSIAKAEKEVTDAGKDEAKIKVAEEKLKKTKEGCEEAGTKIEMLKAVLPLRITMDAIKKSLPSLVDLRKLYLFVRNIVKDHYQYRLPPIYPQGDRLTVVLDMQAQDSVITSQMGFMPTYHDELNLEFSVRNKPLFSFSSGPFIAFGGDLPAKSYGFKRVPASGTVIGPDAKYRLDETGDGPLPIGLGGYAHIGKKFSSNFGLAGTIGVGYTFNQVDILPAFMGGVTVSFGDKQRLNITLGGAGVQVKEVKKELYLGNVYDAAPELEYNKPLRFGYFVGISYSIFTSTSKINLFSKSKK